MDKLYKIKIGCNAGSALRELKNSGLTYCITQYDEGDIYFTILNIVDNQQSILDNMEHIEEVRAKE